MEYRPFLSCLSPVKITDYKGHDFYVPCGDCVICRRAKASKYGQRLRLEERHTPYVYFVTLTYNDWYVPTYRVAKVRQNTPGFEYINPRTGEHITEFHDEFTYELQPCFDRLDRYGKPVVIPNIPLTKYKNYDEIKADYKAYHLHRLTYKNLYCKTNFEPQDGYVDLCYKRDIELFLFNLRNTFKRQFNNSTFRYFAVPDYGTNSLRPHWHLLLFFDSYDAFKAFEDEENFGTVEKPSYAAKCIADLWKYGIVNSSRVQKSAASYVANYINLPSNFPLFILNCQQFRAYHSNRLGEVLSQEDIKTNIVSGNFSRFESVTDYDYAGIAYTYPLWRSFYDTYLPRYPYVGRKSPQTACTIFKKILEYEKVICKNNGGVVPSASSVATSLFCDCSNIDYGVGSSLFRSDWYLPFMDIYHVTVTFGVRSAPLTLKDISVFKNLVYITHRIYKNVVFFYDTFTDSNLLKYFQLINDYQDYRELSNLRDVYSVMEYDEEFADCYYLSLDNRHFDSPLFVSFCLQQYEFISNNIKHKNVSDLYKL